MGQDVRSPSGHPGPGSRCIALVGPFQSGKTTLLEAILARTGAIPRAGSVEAGTSVGDAGAGRDASRHAQVAGGADRPGVCKPAHHVLALLSHRGDFGEAPHERFDHVAVGRPEQDLGILAPRLLVEIVAPEPGAALSCMIHEQEFRMHRQIFGMSHSGDANARARQFLDEL